MVRGCQQQRQHCVAGLVVQMEAVAAVPELVRHGQYVGEGRALSESHCPLETEGADINFTEGCEDSKEHLNSVGYDMKN